MKKLIYNPITSFEIINNYVNQKFDKVLTGKDSMKCFKKLDIFFKTYNFIPNPDLLIELINKNTIFTKMMNVLTAKESIIISLKLGYVDRKYFSTESIK